MASDYRENYGFDRQSIPLVNSNKTFKKIRYALGSRYGHPKRYTNNQIHKRVFNKIST